MSFADDLILAFDALASTAHARELEAGHVVIGPSNVAHGFRNAGEGRLRVIAIHGAPRFLTEWLERDDGSWSSKPGR